MKEYKKLEFEAHEGGGIFVLVGGLVVIGVILWAVSVLSGCAHTMEHLENNPKVLQDVFDKAARKTWQKTCGKFKTAEEQDDYAAELGAADETAYEALNWSMGGFNGSGAVRNPDVAIKNLRMSSNRLDYEWVEGKTMSNWGLGNSEASAVCCLFFKDTSGKWIGGKFDWISTSRTFRDLHHTGTGSTDKVYKDWTLKDKPKETEACFVIVYPKRGERSNVIKGAWHR